ncbi:MlaD family protein [Paraconexibacter antarcticus]|uniref:MlaD family protein n=1 Tax=Paraconexibacter antarcticus TaxID=2949664 RepID=A0ABY5DSW7_9ACTN|nr:MlaD family protein [Paraconexibacter antarcticus]UTI65121.1 MlaD family protein [Paraconexibacter antarcticus]
MNRRPGRSVYASPVLVGAVAILVVVVAVFLAYNANNGLPFVPTYSFKATLPDAQELLPGNDVRVSGTRVGQVTDVTAQDEGGRPVAVVSMQVESSLKPLPRDTRILVRQRSNVGLKYLELQPGHSRATLPEGGTLPLANARAAVDLADVVNTFDPKTRAALRGTISGLGVGLAGRGEALNRSLEVLPATVADLRSVMRTLAARRTDLDGFVRGLDAAATVVAPRAEDLRAVLDRGATTFAALAAERGALGRSIELAAPTERAGARAFRVLAPLTATATALIRDATPGVRQLRVAGPTLAGALRASGPAVGRARAVLPSLDAVVARLRTLSRSRDTTGALQRLTDSVGVLTPLLTFVNPFQTKCNALALWARNVASLASEGTVQGTWFRFLNPSDPTQLLPRSTPSPDLHQITTPDVGQHGECESGNTPYLPGQHIGDAPGRQPDATDQTAPGTIPEMVARERR